MHKAWLLVAVVLLAGCAQSEDGTGPVQETPEDTAAETPQNETVPDEGPEEPPAEDPAPQAEEPVQNETAPDNNTTETNVTQETNVTSNETAPEEVVLVNEHFEGTAPAAVPGEGALLIDHFVTMPEGATRIWIKQESEYTGLVASVLYVYDGQGNQRAVATEDCGWTIAPGVLETWVCEVDFTDDLVPGDWNARIVWQVGEVAETYKLDVMAWGYASA